MDNLDKILKKLRKEFSSYRLNFHDYKRICKNIENNYYNCINDLYIDCVKYCI